MSAIMMPSHVMPASSNARRASRYATHIDDVLDRTDAMHGICEVERSVVFCEWAVFDFGVHW